MIWNPVMKSNLQMIKCSREKLSCEMKISLRSESYSTTWTIRDAYEIHSRCILNVSKKKNLFLTTILDPSTHHPCDVVEYLLIRVINQEEGAVLYNVLAHYFVGPLCSHEPNGIASAFDVNILSVSFRTATGGEAWRTSRLREHQERPPVDT